MTFSFAKSTKLPYFNIKFDVKKSHFAAKNIAGYFTIMRHFAVIKKPKLRTKILTNIHSHQILSELYEVSTDKLHFGG